MKQLFLFFFLRVNETIIPRPCSSRFAQNSIILDRNILGGLTVNTTRELRVRAVLITQPLPNLQFSSN